jgi:sphingolipid 4-desaturase/C4-monooxygenase
VSRTEFHHSGAREPHRERTKFLLSRHPEVRELIGRNPLSFAYVVALVVLQVTVAYAVRAQPFWVMLLVAYLVGAFANHALFVLIHECAHNLVFKRRSSNTWTGILANLPHVIPSSVSFQNYHIKHHSHQGVYELDADLPHEWEARLVGHGAVRKALWLALFPIVQALRPLRLREINSVDRWVATNFLAQMAFDVAVWILWGPMAFFYLLLSLFFGIGLHPLGARWIQRHYMTGESDEQETFSYYGPMNLVAFNVGYHNEHHDLPSIPWNRLPEVRRAAPELYDTLEYHTSWTKLLLKFIFSREISLFSRMTRSERGGIPLSDESRPDQEILATLDPRKGWSKPDRD